jgi:DNA uptake protein ComE-like DNA-binding protein
MKSFKKPFSEWFGYTRRERRATLLLFLLVTIIGFSRHLAVNNEPLPDVELIVIARAVDVPLIKDGDNVSATVRPVARRNIPQPVIELNSCDSADLDALPGIGPVLSARILKYRNLLGGYAEPVQLLEVYGLRQEVYDLFSSRLRTDTTLIKMIYVNSDSYSVMIRHPYLGPENVSSIIRYRERQGKITGWGAMVDGGMIPDEKRALLRYYLSYDFE